MSIRLAGLLTFGVFLSVLAPESGDLQAQTLAKTASDPQGSACPGLNQPVDKSGSPLLIITDAPVPGPKKLRAQPTPAQAKCAEKLRAAGKKAIEKKKVVEGVSRYVAAVRAAPPQAESIYEELAGALDRRGYVQPALAAYFKAWKVVETEYANPEAKMDGVAVLELADIRDSIVRLGGQVPEPTSEVGRTVSAKSTRILREEYFNADPYLSPEKSPASESPDSKDAVSAPPDPKAALPASPDSKPVLPASPDPKSTVPAAPDPKAPIQPPPDPKLPIPPPPKD